MRGELDCVGLPAEAQEHLLSVGRRRDHLSSRALAYLA